MVYSGNVTDQMMSCLMQKFSYKQKFKSTQISALRVERQVREVKKRKFFGSAE